MADAYGSGPYERKFMQVQVLSPAPGDRSFWTISFFCTGLEPFKLLSPAPENRGMTLVVGPLFSFIRPGLEPSKPLSHAPHGSSQKAQPLVGIFSCKKGFLYLRNTFKKTTFSDPFRRNPSYCAIFEKLFFCRYFSWIEYCYAIFKISLCFHQIKLAHIV